MQYQETYTEFDPKILDLIKKTIPASFASALRESGTALDFPQDRELEMKLKYTVSEEGGKFSLKLSWDNEAGENDDDEDEDEEDEEDEDEDDEDDEDEDEDEESDEDDDDED